MSARDESDAEERTVHRVEAFSDIVIGFSLAQLGGSLVLSKGSLDPLGVASFLFAFSIICSLWFFHHRLFQWLFVPRTLPMILNFLWLADVVLLVFVAQTMPRHWGERPLEQLYFGLYAAAYAILALQAAIALRSNIFPTAELRRKAIRQTVFMTYWTGVFAVCLLCVSAVNGLSQQGLAIDATFACGGMGSGLLARYMRRRFAPA